jgi:hypothetical protein
MPRKIRQLIRDLTDADFTLTQSGGKGSQRKFEHARGQVVILSGKDGADAHHYQEKDVRRAIADSKKKEGDTSQ